MTFSIVRQQTKFDCGVAVLAMLCGVDYTAARKALPVSRRGATATAMVEAAQLLGVRCSVERFDHVPVDRMAGDGAVLYLLPRKRMRGHWVMRKGGALLDPETGATTQAEGGRVVAFVAVGERGR